MPKLSPNLPSPRTDVIRLLTAAGFPCQSIRRLTGWRISSASYKTHLSHPIPTLEQRLEWAEDSTPLKMLIGSMTVLTHRLRGTTPPPLADSLVSMRYVNSTVLSLCLDHIRASQHAEKVREDDTLSTAEYHVCAVVCPQILPPHPIPVGPKTTVAENSPFNRSTMTRRYTRSKGVRKTNLDPEGKKPLVDPPLWLDDNEIPRWLYRYDRPHPSRNSERFAFLNPENADPVTLSVAFPPVAPPDPYTQHLIDRIVWPARARTQPQPSGLDSGFVLP